MFRLANVRQLLNARVNISLEMLHRRLFTNTALEFDQFQNSLHYTNNILSRFVI